MKNRTIAALLALSTVSLAGLTTGAQAIEPLPPLPSLPPIEPTPSRRAPAAPVSQQPGLPATVPAPATTAAATATSNRKIVLELGKRTISLWEGSKVLGKWPVAIGDSATPTPKGLFSIRNKVINPQYQSTKSCKNNPTIGANGPLGDRWIGFHATSKDQFGIHGTPPAWAWAVHQGAAVTHGCVRMLGPHVRALFDQVDVGTPVEVKP
ncbi:MAG: L,D-transpeptidase [Cyanobacteria bacterium]|nr:L,D-transpeptidase [Cyanobacteriota bacterium]